MAGILLFTLRDVKGRLCTEELDGRTTDTMAKSNIGKAMSRVMKAAKTVENNRDSADNFSMNKSYNGMLLSKELIIHQATIHKSRISRRISWSPQKVKSTSGFGGCQPAGDDLKISHTVHQSRSNTIPVEINTFVGITISLFIVDRMFFCFCTTKLVLL